MTTIKNQGSITKDWSGHILSAHFHWGIELDSEFLTYRIHWTGPVSIDPNEKSGSFIEGLWNRDVVELFIQFKDSPRYLEVNLAPSGAWWAQEHVSYRVRDLDTAVPKDVKTHSVVTPLEWKASLQLPVSELSEIPEKFHVTGIFDGRFLSSNPYQATEPDFHLSRCFENL